MNNFRWWEEKFHQQVERLMAFEDALFTAFQTIPPSKNMLLLYDKVWSGQEWEPYRYPRDNDDAQEVKNLLDWQPWPRLIGYRTYSMASMIRVELSVEALRYYVPAFMLHCLYFRFESPDIGGEIEELFIPPDDEIICEAFSGYGLRNDRYYDGFWIDRFYWFRDGMSTEQRKVCRDFCALWFSWKWRDRDFSIVENAYVRLLDYWGQ